jgi:hypothetical protein
MDDFPLVKNLDLISYHKTNLENPIFGTLKNRLLCQLL